MKHWSACCEGLVLHGALRPEWRKMRELRRFFRYVRSGIYLPK